jgi:hypothetical protein
MLRVHSNSVLVVPPFECAWLTGEEFLLKDGKGCISFEVKGDGPCFALWGACGPVCASQATLRSPGIYSAASPGARAAL